MADPYIEFFREKELTDVLFEQLQYLLDCHGPKREHAVCRECNRLAEVRKQLLNVGVFDEVIYEKKPKTKDAGSGA